MSSGNAGGGGAGSGKGAAAGVAGSAATGPAAPAQRKLGKYEIRSELGRGSFGRVYLGFDPFVQRQVAIKVAPTSSQADADHFFAEARAIGRLHHPGIVTLFDAGMEGAASYLVMEYVEGETLRRFCKKDSLRPGARRIAEIMCKCALALDYVHSNGVLHKDIKPGNIMVTGAGAAKIMDFGIAALAGADRTATITGSPLFMSPEQTAAMPLTPASDLYSLGMIMYLLASGEQPFNATTVNGLFQQIRYQPAPKLKSKRANLPDAFCDIVDCLLAKNPAERYTSGRKLAEALAPLAQAEASSKRKPLNISHDSLRRLKFFKAFRSPELRELVEASTTATYKAGDTVIKEGETDNALYIILGGFAEVRKGGRLIALLKKGDCFGEIGFLYAVQRTASVIASSEMLVLQVNAGLLEKMSDECQLSYYRVFTENLILRLALTTEKAAQMPEERALDFLLP